MMSSISASLMPSISDWSRPNLPARLGPYRFCIRPMTFRSAQMASSVATTRNTKITMTLSRISHHGSSPKSASVGPWPVPAALARIVLAGAVLAGAALADTARTVIPRSST